MGRQHAEHRGTAHDDLARTRPDQADGQVQRGVRTGPRAGTVGETFDVAALAGPSGAASVALAAGSGFLGGSYATTFGFFGVAQENLGLAAAAALLLLVTSPAALF